jgi:ectoine hydroxylase-related dioxygenase (phytanoyl-CoA dioxygenase family)
MSISKALETEGFCVVPGLLSAWERWTILAHHNWREGPPDSDWSKGRASLDPFYHRLVTKPKLLAVVRSALGDDVIQWGMDIVHRPPGTAHPWHCDIESSALDGGFVTIWIGITHTSVDSALTVISRSHSFGHPVQEEAHIRGFSRGQATDADVLAWAKARDSQAELVKPELRNGDALVFDGRLWHGSRNGQKTGTRTAVLIQYARADKAVRMFDPQRLGWPIQVRQEPLPPVLVVAGKAHPDKNRIVSAPGGG